MVELADNPPLPGSSGAMAALLDVFFLRLASWALQGCMLAARLDGRWRDAFSLVEDGKLVE